MKKKAPKRKNTDIKEFEILYYLLSRKEVSIEDIVEFFNVTKYTAKLLLKNMIKRGYVFSYSHSVDKTYIEGVLSDWDYMREVLAE